MYFFVIIFYISDTIAFFHNIWYNIRVLSERNPPLMKCIYCGHSESKVVDSRPTDESNSIRRRRECLNCQRRFTTYEIVESLPIIVVKRDGSRQGFDRNKVLNSMVRAFDKRQVEIAELDRITTEIEQTIQNTLEREVSTARIGEMVMERIKPLDEVAYIRFASVYRQFKDVQSFMMELQQLLDTQNKPEE